MPPRSYALFLSSVLIALRKPALRRALLLAAWGIGIGFILWISSTATPSLADGYKYCDGDNIPPQLQYQCAGWQQNDPPSASGTQCKLEQYTSTGESIGTGQSAICYPPGPAPPGTFPCEVVTASGWALGSCKSGSGGGPPPAGEPTPGIPPPPTPAPTPPNVGPQSCTTSPPSTWYDPDAPVGSTATTWGEPTEPNGMIIQNVPINNIAPAWEAPARNLGSWIFNALFVFEIFMLGLQALLHRSNPSQIFSGLAFKTFVVTFFIYLMSNAPTILPQIVNYSFKIAGQQTGVTNTTNLMDMYHQSDSAAELFFCAAMASHIDDNETANDYGHFSNMFGAPGAAGTPGQNDYIDTLQGTVGHITFEFFVQALGILVIVSTGIMFLSLALITSESYIVMFAGVFFLAFSSMRFTLPFTQGYLSYAINIGVKLFTYWVIIAIETSLLLPALKAAGQKLIGAASIQFGSQAGGNGQEYYLVYASVSVAQIFAMGLLTWIIPNAFGRFISRRNSAAAINAISMTVNALRGGRPSPALAVTARNALPPEALSPAQLVQESVRVAPSQEQRASLLSIINIPRASRPGNAAPPFAQTLVSSASASGPSSDSVVTTASIDKGATVSGMYTQAVQASVSDGPDPFAAKPKPVVMNVHPQKPSAAPPPPTESTSPENVGDASEPLIPQQPPHAPETS